MTDTNTNTSEPTVAAKEAPAPRERSKKGGDLYATLERGQNYAVRFEGKNYRFKGGVKVGPLPDGIEAYLNETAVDLVTVSEGDGSSVTESRPKFSFERA